MTVFRSNISQANRLAMLFVSVLCIGVLEFLGVFGSVRHFSEWVFLPLLRGSAFAIHMLEQPYFLVRSAQKRYTSIQDMELRFAEASAQLSELERTRQENRELRAMIEGSASSSMIGVQHRSVLAPILAYGQPVIGKGARAGIQVGDIVLLAQTYIGRVSEVSQEQSKIVLLTATNAVSNIVQTETGVTGVLAGANNTLILREVPAEAVVEVGQRVITSGQAGVPAGLLVGRVGSIQRSPTNGSQIATVDQGVSFYQSQLVEVQTR